MVDIKGRWALVTGAARGIGRGAALFLAERGCNLVLHGRTKEHCEKTAEEARKYGVEVITVGAELSDLKQVEAMLSEIDAKGKDIDIILNNAGIQVAYRTEYLSTPASDYEESFKINTIAPMMILYHFLPGMEKRGFGRVVNTTSGIRLEPQQAGYSASKAALDKVTMDLAAKYEGTNVCINITDPGWCRTDLGGSQAPNAPESSLPGVVVGAFIDDKKSGRNFAAGNFYGLTLEEAVAKAENGFPVYTGSVAYI
ncbi:MAG: SDR family oxidoreductase [Lachnospiraceae bacterium]|nr:SDR family oxidoreductase [Lachnospiraceae bacterium]